MKRSVLITGASNGIGQAIACRLAADGFIVVLQYLNDRPGADETLQKIKNAGGVGRILCFNVCDHAHSRLVLEADIAAHGAYYGVISNAGITCDDTFSALDEAAWNTVIQTNLNSFYNVLHPCIMPMIGLRSGGRIITLSCVSGLMGNRGQVNYNAAKAGIIGATRALAVELAKRRITVNNIAPGLIDTGITQLEGLTSRETINLIPMRRMGTTEEVAGLASYLMSDIAAYVTRQVISINGGLL